MFDINNNNLNFNIIKKRIEDFKKRDSFEEYEYSSILEDLEKLYNQRRNSFLFWNKDKEINNFKWKKSFQKYLVFNLFTKLEYDIN